MFSIWLQRQAPITDWQQHADLLLPMCHLSWKGGEEDKGEDKRVGSWKVKVVEEEDVMKICEEEEEKEGQQDLVLMRLTVCWLRGTRHSINTCPRRWHTHTYARTHTQTLPEAIILPKGFLHKLLKKHSLTITRTHAQTHLVCSIKYQTSIKLFFAKAALKNRCWFSVLCHFCQKCNFGSHHVQHWPGQMCWEMYTS